MPRIRLPRREEDPFRRINNWDDGYGYLKTSNPASPSWEYQDHSARPAVPSPPREAWEDKSRSRDTSKRHPDAYARHRYPSPPSDSDRRARGRRDPPRSPSPPRRKDRDRDRDHPHRRESSPPPRRTRPGLEARATAPPPRTRSFKEPDTRRPHSYTHSPSPRRRSRSRSGSRDRDRHRPRSRYPSPSRGRDRDDRRRSRYPSPSSSPTRPAPKRPTIHRSATTSAAKPESKAKSFTLSPRWQKAAAAALQAGGLAALNMRSQPGAWNGAKGARVATAALAAGVGDVFKNRNDSGGDNKRGEKGRERSRDRDRDRGRSDRGRDDRSRRSGRDRDEGRGRRSEVEVLGNVLGGFIADRWAKRGK